MFPGCVNEAVDRFQAVGMRHVLSELCLNLFAHAAELYTNNRLLRNQQWCGC